MASISSNKKLDKPRAPALKLPLPSLSQAVGHAACLVAPSNGKLVAVDSQFAEFFGATPTRCIQHSVFDFFPALKAEIPCLEEISAISKPLVLATVVCGADSTIHQISLSISPLYGQTEDCLLVSIRPQESNGETLWPRDAVTGLPDRRDLSLHRSRWKKTTSDTRHPHALLFLDLDHFKQVNDSHGHAAGDQVLSTLASRWQRCIRENDLLVRYGGDEFVVLLAGVCLLNEVEPIVDRLVAATSEPIIVNDQTVRVGITIGVSLAEDTSDDLEQLIARADRDMYQQKKQLGSKVNKPR